MNDPLSLAEARAAKAHDNRLWSPLDCLDKVRRDIESGEIKPRRLMVVYEELVDEAKPEGLKHQGRYLANVPLSEQIAMLEWEKFWTMMRNRAD